MTVIAGSQRFAVGRIRPVLDGAVAAVCRCHGLPVGMCAEVAGCAVDTSASGTCSYVYAERRCR